MRRDQSSVRRMVGVGERCGFRVSIGCCQLWASCLGEEAVVVVAEAAVHSCRIAVVVAGPKHVSYQFRERLPLSMPCAYLIVSILLRRRRRLAVVVVEGWLRALVSVLLWRSGIRQHRSSFARHCLLTERRIVAVEEGILGEVERHSCSEAAARRSHRHRGIAGQDSRTCRVAMCDCCRGFLKCPRVLAEMPDSRG